MDIAVVAIAFENSLENRGTTMNLCSQRAESFKVAKRIAKNKNGIILRKIGDLFKVDCAVTGSSYGTDSNPKFPLKLFFEKKIFLYIADLVREGEDYEGYIAVFQGDNTGPHADVTYHTFFREFCREKG